MAETDFPLIPGNPRNVILRPLDKGVILHMPPQSLPAGGFLEAKGVSVNPSGLTRRPVFRYYGNSLSAFSYPPLQNIQVFWNIAGAQKAIAWDDKFIYLVSSDAITGVYWKYSTGTCAVSGTTVTGSGTNWTESSFELQAGDVIVLDADGSGDGPEAIEVASITDATHLQTVTAAVGTYAAGTDYEIRRAFDADEPFMVDYAVVPGTANKMVFADGSRFLYAYDGSTFNDFKSTISYIPRAVAYFQDRVWIGNITESSEEHKQGIRWSNVFPNVDAFDSDDIIDLPYQQGELMRLVPMGFYLMAYFKDRVFLGRRSNKVGLPLQFDPMETGSIGLVGTRAVVPWIGGHFFLGQDNVYWLTINGVDPEGIATPIVKESIAQCGDMLWRVYGVHYPTIDSIMFAFPRSSDDFERIWLFNYKSKSWSEWPLTGEMLAVGAVSDIITYSNWVDYAPYETGTVAGTASGTTLTLTGGNFATGPGWAPLVAGDYVHIIDEAGASDDTVTTYTVASVTDATHLEIAETFAYTFSGKNYQIVEKGSTYAALSKYDSYQQIQPVGPVEKTLFMGRAGYLYYFQLAGTYDEGGAGVPVQLTTGDMDFGLPDTNKVWNRLSMKTDDTLESEVRFRAYFSEDRGRTWKDLGTLVIPQYGDEGYVNFRSTSSLGRFRLVSESRIEPYTITELVVRVKPLGQEVPTR